MVARGKQVVPVRSLAVNHNFKKETLMRACFVCQAELPVYSEPVFVPRGAAVSERVNPCLGGPFICLTCRMDRKKLAATREEMERHFVLCAREAT